MIQPFNFLVVPPVDMAATKLPFASIALYLSYQHLIVNLISGSFYPSQLSEIILSDRFEPKQSIVSTFVPHQIQNKTNKKKLICLI